MPPLLMGVEEADLVKMEVERKGEKREVVEAKVEGESKKREKENAGALHPPNPTPL